MAKSGHRLSSTDSSYTSPAGSKGKSWNEQVLEAGVGWWVQNIKDGFEKTALLSIFSTHTGGSPPYFPKLENLSSDHPTHVAHNDYSKSHLAKYFLCTQHFIDAIIRLFQGRKMKYREGK